MNLYTNHAQEFSNTRQIPWKGWEKIPALFKDKQINVLDLGCGNGRFLKFLLDEKIEIKDYVGVDSSQELLNIFQLQKPLLNLDLSATFSLVNSDLNSSSWTSNLYQTFDLISIFGLMHHLEDAEARVNILKESKKLLRNDGYIIVSFWQFLDLERLKNKIVEDLGNNDFKLSFGKNGATRFCHYTSSLEARSLAEQAELKIIDEYFEDGENGKLNFYLVLRKD